MSVELTCLVFRDIYAVLSQTRVGLLEWPFVRSILSIGYDFFLIFFFKQTWSACEWKLNCESFSVSQMILVFASPKTTVLELKWILWMRIAVVGRPQFEYFYYFSSHSAKLHLKQNTLRFQHKNTVQCLRVIWVPQSCWYQAWETCCAAFPSFCLSPLVS